MRGSTTDCIKCIMLTKPTALQIKYNITKTTHYTIWNEQEPFTKQKKERFNNSTWQHGWDGFSCNVEKNSEYIRHHCAHIYFI